MDTEDTSRVGGARDARDGRVGGADLGGDKVVVGLMAGTSMGDVDAAVVRFTCAAPVQGTPHLPLGSPPDSLPRLPYTYAVIESYAEVPYPPRTAQLLRSLLDPRPRPPMEVLDSLTRARARVGRAFASAAVAALALTPWATGDVAVVASHGQTVYHAPPSAVPEHPLEAGSLQIGDPAVLSECLGAVPVVADFRSADVAAGGEGAPLIPYVDAVLFRCPDETRVLVNLGGIANVTCLGVDPADPLVAFDTGPANILMDAIVQAAGRGDYDVDGALAAAGTAVDAAVDAIMDAEPYFARSPPKATGRELFGAAFVASVLIPAMAAAGHPDPDSAVEDQVATAALLTARSLAQGIGLALSATRSAVPSSPVRVLVSGGGAANGTLMGWIHEAVMSTVAAAGLTLAGLSTTSDHTGIANFDDCKEAVGFAILGLASSLGLASNVPSATGAAGPRTLGLATLP